MSNNIHENDVGTRFTVVIVDDDTGEAIPLQQATVKNIAFKPPIEASFTREATLTTDGSDGSIYYDTVDGDLTPVGDWEVQGQVEGSTYENSSEIKEFKVLPKL